MIIPLLGGDLQPKPHFRMPAGAWASCARGMAAKRRPIHYQRSIEQIRSRSDCPAAPFLP